MRPRSSYPIGTSIEDESHGLDATTALSFAMDLAPLTRDHPPAPRDYVQGFSRGRKMTA